MNKIIVVGIILLFIGVGFQPVISIEINNSNEIIEVDKECFECNLIDSISTQEINRLLIRTKSIVNYISLVFGDIQEIKENCIELLIILNDGPILDMICNFLISIIDSLYAIQEKIYNLKDILYPYQFLITILTLMGNGMAAIIYTFYALWYLLCY